MSNYDSLLLEFTKLRDALEFAQTDMVDYKFTSPAGPLHRVEEALAAIPEHLQSNYSSESY